MSSVHLFSFLFLFLLLTADEAEFVPAFSKSLFLFGKVDILGASGANSGHCDDQLFWPLIENEMSVNQNVTCFVLSLKTKCHFFKCR